MPGIREFSSCDALRTPPIALLPRHHQGSSTDNTLNSSPRPRQPQGQAQGRLQEEEREGAREQARREQAYRDHHRAHQDRGRCSPNPSQYV